MGNNTSPSQKVASLGSKLFTLVKFPFLLVIGLVAIIIFFAAMVISMFGSGNNSSLGGSISELGQNEIPQEYIAYYKQAEAEYGVPWNLLAAIHKVETDFGRYRPMVSSVGAVGHFQFMPCTFVGWRHPTCGGVGKGNISNSDLTNPEIIKKYGGYGVDGDGDGKADPFNVIDAIYSAANKLSKEGAANGNYEEALLQYNSSTEYVQKVLSYATSYVNTTGSGSTFISDSGFAWPVPYTKRVSSPFGYRIHPITKQYKMHNGIDIAESGVAHTPVLAASSGKVSFAGRMDTYGNVVFIEHGNGIQTRYAHLASINVRVGANVGITQQVGTVGNTGGSTGYHLHFEIRMNGTPYDPLKFY